MGLWSTIGKIGAIGAAPFTGGASLAALPAIGAAGEMLGGFAQGQASNRGNEYSGQLDLARLIMERERMRGEAENDYFNQSLSRAQDNRAGRSSAFRSLLAAARLKSPGPRPQLSPYSIAPRTPTGDEVAGADALSAEVLARLQNGSPLPEVTRREIADPLEGVDAGLLRPGRMERILGVASPVLTAIGSLGRVNEGR